MSSGIIVIQVATWLQWHHCPILSLGEASQYHQSWHRYQMCFIRVSPEQDTASIIGAVYIKGHLSPIFMVWFRYQDKSVWYPRQVIGKLLTPFQHIVRGDYWAENDISTARAMGIHWLGWSLSVNFMSSRSSISFLKLSIECNVIFY